MDRVAHGLCRTAQVAGDFFGTLLSTGGQQDLTSTQGKGIRGAQSSFYPCLLIWTQGSDIHGGFHALILSALSLLKQEFFEPALGTWFACCSFYYSVLMSRI